MTEKSVTQHGTPPAVVRLDAWLNRRILSAHTPDETRHWWQLKVDAKRALARMAPGDIDGYISELECSAYGD